MAKSRPTSVAGLSFLWLLGSWLEGHAFKTKTFKIHTYQGGTLAMDCAEGELLHVESAIWSVRGGRCNTRVNRLPHVRARCENKRRCRIRPHWSRNDGELLNLGELCHGVGEWLDGNAGCWKKCKEVDCQDGKCVPLTWNTYQCKCNPGASNLGGVKSSHCVNACKDNPCDKGKCMKEGEGYKCLCFPHHEFADGTCKPIDTCLQKNGGCDSKAKCTDGMGKEPTCVCPEHYNVAEDGKKCVDINECETDNGGCDPNATCHNHVGKPATCDCNEGYVEKDKKCVRPGSFIFPANAVVKAEFPDVLSNLKLRLGACMSIDLDITTGEVKVAHDKQEQKGTLSVQQLKDGYVLFLLHRNKDIMETVVFATQKGGKKPQGPLYVNVKWDEDCRSDQVTAEGEFSKSPSPNFFRTTNLRSDVPAAA